MIITKKRIRRLSRYLPSVLHDGEFTFGVRVTPAVGVALPSLGFSMEWVEGETVLPPARGPVSTANAEGWLIVHRDRPMETAYREFEWTWEEWHGPYRQEQSRIVFQPYERYPRTRVPPPSIELSTVSTPQGPMVVVSTNFQRSNDETMPILAANLLLEIFGHAEVLTANLAAFAPKTVTRVNWEVLPPGKHPWKSLSAKVENLLSVQGERKRPVYEHRWSTIANYQPDFVAVGRAGFAGYLIFGFPSKGVYVLESAYYGNATYVLEGDWERLSQLTKRELLDAALHKERIVHHERWDGRIRGLLN
jgi:hypothetical protein